MHEDRWNQIEQKKKYQLIYLEQKTDIKINFHREIFHTFENRGKIYSLSLSRTLLVIQTGYYRVELSSIGLVNN